MSLRDVKAKIRSVDRTRKVTKAMEAVSAVKMRKSQQRAIGARPYARSALNILSRLSPSLATTSHPLTKIRDLRRVALVVVTSDKGLCGALNSSVIKAADRTISELGLTTENIDIVAYGKKSAEYFERRGYNLVQRHENISDDVEIESLHVTTNLLTNSFVAENIDRAIVVYTNFRSTFEQEAAVHTLLPLSLESFSKIVRGITPEKGALSGAPEQDAPAAYTSEGENVAAELLSMLSSVFLFHLLLESKASEHSARMVAMKNASDKSRDVSKALTRTFNKARQAAITREVSEIVGGIEAMAAN